MTMFITFRQVMHGLSPSGQILHAGLEGFTQRDFQLAAGEKLPNVPLLPAGSPYAFPGMCLIKRSVHKANERAFGLAFAQYIRQHGFEHAVNTVTGQRFCAR
jgi:hypothetical protein